MDEHSKNLFNTFFRKCCKTIYKRTSGKNKRIIAKIFMTKTELRDIYREKRNTISSKEKLKLDDLLLIQFQQLYFEDVRTLFTYWPKAGAQEPNTHLFSGYLRHTIPSLQIAYP